LGHTWKRKERNLRRRGKVLQRVEAVNITKRGSIAEKASKEISERMCMLGCEHHGDWWGVMVDKKEWVLKVRVSSLLSICWIIEGRQCRKAW